MCLNRQGTMIMQALDLTQLHIHTTVCAVKCTTMRGSSRCVCVCARARTFLLFCIIKHASLHRMINMDDKTHRCQ